MRGLFSRHDLVDMQLVCSAGFALACKMLRHRKVNICKANLAMFCILVWFSWIVLGGLLRFLFCVFGVH